MTSIYFLHYNGDTLRKSAVISTGTSADRSSPLYGGLFSLDTKDFKPLDEQVRLLKDRKLIIHNESDAKLYLLSNNYYNIINGYSKFFPLLQDTYTNKTTFDEVTKLYLFDKELKQAFFKATIDVESHLKAIFAHRFAEKYPHHAYAYLDTHAYDSGKIIEVSEMISRLSKIIKKEKRYNTSISHYIKKYNNVPIWVLMNYLNFGELRHMILLVPVSLQNTVAKDVSGFIKQHISNPGVFPPEIMLSFLSNINDIRNVCAHNNRLLNFRCKTQLKHWTPLYDKYNVPNDASHNNVYTTFLATQCFLSKIEYATLHNKVRKLINGHLKNHLHSVDVNDILKTLGFPANWHIDTAKIDTTKSTPF